MKHGIATLLLVSGLAPGQESTALPFRTRTALPNVNGSMDHFVDVKGQRLFVCALGNHTAVFVGTGDGATRGLRQT